LKGREIYDIFEIYSNVKYKFKSWDYRSWAYFMNLSKKKRVIVGINVGHDGGTAIVINGKIQCAISEERLSRKKYSSGYLASLFYCLNALNLKISDISLVVFSSYGNRLSSNYQGELKSLGIPGKKFISVDHHLSHAFGAYFLSPFDDALVIIIDGRGNEDNTESYYVAEGQNIKKIGGNSRKRNPVKGIGRAYESFTNFLGWIDQEAGKTMALAAYGDASSIKTSLFKLKGIEVESTLDYKYEKGAIDFIRRHSLPFGEPYAQGRTSQSYLAAAYIQQETERIIADLISSLVEKTGKNKICLAGGVALNCCANAKLVEKNIVDDIFILPASSDKGQAIGNALYGFYKLEGYIPRNILTNDYFGREYSEEEIIAVLSRKKGYVEKHIPNRGFAFRKERSIVKTTAELLRRGKIIGWFQGKSELGPRALGHRSILCDPRKKEMKDILNKKVKHREWFRPFAPSCLLERTPDYFEFKKPSPYMLFAVPVKPGKKHEIPAVMHIDNTARLQTVTRKDNDIFYKLIKEFYNLTNIPLVLNTSFNDRTPIVETPEDALATFLNTDLDYFAIGNLLVWKK